MKQGFLINTDECSKPYTFAICEPSEVIEILSKRSELEFNELEEHELLKLSSGGSVTVLGTCDGYREDPEEEDEYTYEQEFCIIPYEYLAREGDTLHVHVHLYRESKQFVVGYNTIEDLQVALTYAAPRIKDFSFVMELPDKGTWEYSEEKDRVKHYITLTKVEVEAQQTEESPLVEVWCEQRSVVLGIFRQDDTFEQRVKQRMADLGLEDEEYSTEEIEIR
jgi:hypothetical protein